MIAASLLNRPNMTLAESLDMAEAIRKQWFDQIRAKDTFVFYQPFEPAQIFDVLARLLEGLYPQWKITYKAADKLFAAYSTTISRSPERVIPNALFIHFSPQATYQLDNLATLGLRLFGNDLELSRLLVRPDVRNRKIGTAITKIVKVFGTTFDKRVLLYPCPLFEDANNMSNSEILEHKQRLQVWYAKLGFLKALPEFVNAIQLHGRKPRAIGLHGLMTFKGDPHKNKG